MFNYTFEKSNEDSQTSPVKLYSRKTSQSWLDEDEERDEWHEEFPDFAFLKQLSTTQSSTVWLVKDQRDNTQYAAKIVPKIENQNLEKSHQLEELEFLQKIHLSLSVKTYQIQCSDDFYLILMEYLKQGDLASYTQNYAQNNMHKYSTQHFQWVRFCFKQIVNCVNQLHQNGFVHRDLKPQNFLIDNLGNLKLNDFGLVTKENTEDTLYCGTPSYMAPQRLDSKKSKLPISRLSDMWALGIILYELLTGRVPYQEDDREQLLQLIYSNFIDFDSQIEESLKNLISQLLQINPGKRISMDELKRHPYLRNDE